MSQFDFFLEISKQIKVMFKTEIEKLEIESGLWAGVGSLPTPCKCWNDVTVMGYPKK